MNPFPSYDTKAQNLGKFFLIIPHLFFAGQAGQLNDNAMRNALFQRRRSRSGQRWGLCWGCSSLCSGRVGSCSSPRACRAASSLPGRDLLCSCRYQQGLCWSKRAGGSVPGTREECVRWLRWTPLLLPPCSLGGSSTLARAALTQTGTLRLHPVPRTG